MDPASERPERRETPEGDTYPRHRRETPYGGAYDHEPVRDLRPEEREAILETPTQAVRMPQSEPRPEPRQEPRPDPPTEAQRTEAPTEKRPAVAVRRLRRGRLAIRKIDPWAVLKFSLVFYFCMLLIMLLGTAIIFAILKIFGVIENLEQFLRDLEFDVTIAGASIFRWFFLIGLVGTVIASAITTFMAFLYNLIADVVGGIELLVTERDK